MKKFLLFLLFLIILGAAGFFLGWAHLTVPTGSYGVMRSKTHGLDTQVIRDGEFRWLWYKLIPTNVDISVFTISPVRRSFRSTGSLSSGQIYAQSAGINANFTWEVAGEIRFTLRPELLPEIASREDINDDAGLRTAEENIALRIENLLIQRIRAYAEDEQRMESMVMTASLPALTREIESLFPEIENLVCTINVVRFPDFSLYRSLRSLYEDFLSHQSQILSQDLAFEAERRINTRLRLEELAQYGELLTRFPILLEYMALEHELDL
ncbi:MAG: hypothetical protein FWG77_07865 [Treponema sp.]|nr:hypothetical protein [Treponema sp.]